MPVLWSLRKTLFICFLLSNTSSVTLKHSIVIYTKYLFQHLVNFWKILTALTKGQTENISKIGSTCHILKFPLMHATFIKLKIVKRRKLNELNCSGNCGHVSGGTVENFSLGVNPIWMVFTDRERNSVGGKKIQEKEKLCFESSQTFYNKFNLIFKGRSCISINSQNSIQHISLLFPITILLVDIAPPAAPCQTDDNFLEDQLWIGSWAKAANTSFELYQCASTKRIYILFWQRSNLHSPML